MDVPVILVAKRCREFLVGLPIEIQKTIVGTFADLKPSEKPRLIFLYEAAAPQHKPIVGHFYSGDRHLAPLADRKSTRLHSSHYCASRMPSSARKKTQTYP